MHTHCISWHHTTRMSGMQYDQTRFDVRGRPQCALGWSRIQRRRGGDGVCFRNLTSCPTFETTFSFLMYFWIFESCPDHTSAITWAQCVLVFAASLHVGSLFPSTRASQGYAAPGHKYVARGREGRGAGAEKRREESTRRTTGWEYVGKTRLAVSISQSGGVRCHTSCVRVCARWDGWYCAAEHVWARSHDVCVSGRGLG